MIYVDNLIRSDPTELFDQWVYYRSDRILFMLDKKIRLDFQEKKQSSIWSDYAEIYYNTHSI